MPGMTSLKKRHCCQTLTFCCWLEAVNHRCCTLHDADFSSLNCCDMKQQFRFFSYFPIFRNDILHVFHSRLIKISSNSLKADSHIACRSHAVPLPCRAAKSLECVFPISFTQCGRVWFTLAMPCPCHAPTMPFFSRPQHNTAFSRRPCCAVALRRTAWSEHGMASVNQTRPHCVNQMGKTHSKPLAARHDRGKVWARHGHGMLCVNRP